MNNGMISDSSTMFHPYLLGDVLAGEMVYENHQHDDADSEMRIHFLFRLRQYIPTIKLFVMFRSTGNPTSAAGTIWGVPSHASKLQYRDANDQKNLRDQKESDDDSDDSNDSDSDDSDVDCNYSDDD